MSIVQEWEYGMQKDTSPAYYKALNTAKEKARSKQIGIWKPTSPMPASLVRRVMAYLKFWK